MSEGRDLTDELLDEEPQGPSPGGGVALEAPQGRDLTPELTPEPSVAPQPLPDEYNLRGPLSGLPWYIKTPLAAGTSAVGGWGGAALGGAVGSAVPVIGTGVGGTTGYLAGNAAARWLNVKLGLEEPGLLGDVLSVALPAGMKGGGALIKQGVRKAPGAAVVRHEMAEEMVEGLGKRLKPAMASEDLFAAAAQHNPDIPALSLWSFADELVQEQAFLKANYPKLANDTIAAIAQQGKDLVTRYGGKIPMQEFEIYRKAIGELVGEARSQGGAHLKGLQKMYAGFMTDMERAIATGAQGTDILRQGIKAHRTEKALESLADIWGPGKGIQQVEGNVTQVMGKRIQNNFQKLLTDDPLFKGSFTPAELLDIDRTLAMVAQYAPGGSPLSHGRFANATHVAAIAAGGVAAWSKQDPVLGVGVAMGVEALPAIIATLMTSKGGRVAIRLAMKDSAGILTDNNVAFLAASARALLAATEPEQPQPGISGYPWGESQQAPGGPARSTD